jgi:hypothetical protein
MKLKKFFGRRINEKVDPKKRALMAFGKVFGVATYFNKFCKIDLRVLLRTFFDSCAACTLFFSSCRVL